MDTTAIFQALPDDKNVHIYLLFEAGCSHLTSFRYFARNMLLQCILCISTHN